jgi:Ca-activated chloride channel homolog
MVRHTLYFAIYFVPDVASERTMNSFFKVSDPAWLELIWASVLLFFLAFFYGTWRSGRLLKAIGTKGKFLTDSLSRSKRQWHIFLQCLALACFGLALSRPLMGSRQTEVKQTGVEMIIAVDVSNSMLAEDDKPSRLDHAKHEINQLLDMLSGDRVGLIAFAGSAILVSPMTSDHSAVKLFLSALSTNSVSTQGTNFKDVMDEAVRAFDRGGVEGLNGTKPTRVLLIASDGEDNEPGGLAEAKKAVDAGIKIFALGFGSERGAPIPVRDDRGQLRGYKQDRSGKVVMSIPSDKGLARLTSVGGGSYYHFTFDESELKNLVSDFDKLEKADFRTRMATEFDEKFQIPLLAGLVIAFFELLFGDRRRGARPWRGRFEI